MGHPSTMISTLPAVRSSRLRMALLALPICLNPSFQMWQRNVNAHGVAIWVLWKTIEMHSILGLPPQIQRPAREVVTVTDLDHAEKMGVILSYAEDTDVVFIFVDANVYMVQLNPVQSKRLHETSVSLTTILSRVSIHQAQPLLVDVMELKTLHSTLDDCLV